MAKPKTQGLLKDVHHAFFAPKLLAWNTRKLSCPQRWPIDHADEMTIYISETRIIGLHFRRWWTVIVWACLTFKFLQWVPKKHLFCNSVFWLFKVIQGQWFWYQSKVWLLISRSLWLWSYHAPWDMATYWLKIVYFSYPSHSMPLLPKFPLEFRGQVNLEETRVTRLSDSEDRMILAWVVLTWYRTVSDRWTDSQTESIIANRRNLS